ncbi:MAG: hypothetical protein P8176_07835 [Gammaproteobacteria bacterium]
MHAVSRPEKIGLWMFETSANWRNVLAFGLVAALTYISIRFNIELGKLSSVDQTSSELLPTGYALLDVCTLFLSGYVGLRTRSPVRKFIAWVWFVYLLSLSLWSAAAFTLSVDYRQSIAALDHQIEQKHLELDRQQETVALWQDNVRSAVKYKTKHQGTLSVEEAKAQRIADELSALEARRLPAAQVIYQRAEQLIGVDAAQLQLLVRLAWAAALTLSPIVLMLLLVVEFGILKTARNTPTLPPERKRFLSDRVSDAENQTLSSKPANSPAQASVTANLTRSSQASLPDWVTWIKNLIQSSKAINLPAQTGSTANLTRSSKASLPDRVSTAKDLTQSSKTANLPVQASSTANLTRSSKASLPDRVNTAKDLTQSSKTANLPVQVSSTANLTRLSKAANLPVQVKETQGTHRVSSPDRHDTGTQEGGKNNRYEQVKKGILELKVKPSIPSIKRVAQCGQGVAVKYLSQLESEGVLRRNAHGRYEHRKS